MNVRAAFFLSCSLLFVLLGNYFFFNGSHRAEIEKVVISRAIDGDTVVLEDNRTVRLVNINTPEKNERGYREAQTFLAQYESRPVLLSIEGTEKYGRLLGNIYFGEHYLNLELVRQGLGHSFLVSEDKKKTFFEAQQQAFNERKGIWNRSVFYGCIEAEIDKKDEYVRIRSSCASTLKGWTIKDETTHPYTFEENVSEYFVLWSEKGEDTRTDLYWGRGNVWNDDRDSLFIRDENELLVLYIPYGY